MISVCLASYNGEKYIKDQVDSVLSQLSDKDELIVSDDGSTDGTLEILQEISKVDFRLKIIKNETCHGIRGNSVNALKQARGDIIFPCDQDDIWLPGKVEKMTAALSGFDMVHHDSIVVDDDLKVLAPSLYEIKHNGPGLIKNMLKGSFYGSHMCITRKLLDRCFPFPKNDEVGHDLWIGLVANMTCKSNYIQDKLIYYRRHDASHCDLFYPSKRPLYKKIYGRLVMIKEILKFLLNIR